MRVGFEELETRDASPLGLRELEAKVPEGIGVEAPDDHLRIICTGADDLEPKLVRGEQSEVLDGPCWDDVLEVLVDLVEDFKLATGGVGHGRADVDVVVGFDTSEMN